VSSDDAVERERQRYRELFDGTPAAYLVTDMYGQIREANRRASRLLGATSRSLTGQPLVSFVDAEHRVGFRERLARADRLHDEPPWVLRVRARGGEPVTVAVSVSVSGGPDDSTGLRWLLLELPAGLRQEREQPLSLSLDQVALAAHSLLRADHLGVVLMDEQGTHQWVVAAGGLGGSFDRISEALVVGPCLEAMRRGRPVWTRDVGADSRWPELISAAAQCDDVRGALAASVVAEGMPVGACVALTASARVWGESELAAMRAFAAVIGRAVADQER
jgi:PAS domain S-box-containing protein